MPGVSSRSQGPLKVLKITDFTAGIYSMINSNQQVYSVPSPGQKVTFSTNSYGVLGLAAGGLLFGPTPYYSDTPSITLPSGMTNPIISGMVRGEGYLGPSNPDYTNFFVVNGTNSSGYSLYAVYEYAAQGGPGSNLGAVTSTQAYTDNFLTYPFLTTMVNSSGDYTQALIFTAFPTTNYSQPYIVDSSGIAAMTSRSTVGVAIPANGRVWYMSQGPFAIDNGPTGRIICNSFDYSAPSIGGAASNYTLPYEGTLIDYDAPSTFGGWGCVSSTDNMLIKSEGGGVIVSGDIFNPTISRAPAVQGTNGLCGNACLTPQGLVYRSNNRGVWYWDGSATSTKLSNNVNDYDFFTDIYAGNIQYTAPMYPNVPGSIYNIQYIQNMIFVDGGMFYDPSTGAWWNLPPYLTGGVVNYVQAPMFYAENVSGFGSFMTSWFGEPNSSTTFNTTYYSFDVSAPTIKSSHYAFTPPTGTYGSNLQTNPIQLPSDGIVEIQEIDVVIQGKGTFALAINKVGGETLYSRQVSVSELAFTRIRYNMNVQTDVLVLILSWTQSTSTGQATPMIESIEIKYVDRFPAGSAQ